MATAGQSTPSCGDSHDHLHHLAAMRGDGMSLQLRPYQREAVAAVLADYPNVIKVVGAGPAGGFRVLCRCQQCGKPFSAVLSRVQNGQRFCSRQCRGEDSKARIRERFWARIDQSGGPDACWPWQGKSHADFGYGVLGIGGRRENGGRTEKAHRVAWLLTHGELPNLFVCHSCDSPLCCNPAHLFLGTNSDNVADMKRKGRHTHGECSYAKLTESQVIEIRERYANEQISQAMLARDYSISSSMVGNIVRRKAWKHVK